jgi:hypothetical protein
MNRMQEWLERAAKELGIEIIVGFVIRLPDGSSFTTQALLPNLGADKGTVVIDSSFEVNLFAERYLLEQGFTISSFSAPLQNEIFDLDGYAEMFSEWGWTGDESLKPEWMT